VFFEGFFILVSSVSFSVLISFKVLSIYLLSNSSTKNTAKAYLNIIKRYEFKIIESQNLLSIKIWQKQINFLQFLEYQLK
jgi:hypothetical protein